MHANQHRGFTLIEVVVALTILSMIVMATLSAMRTIGKTQTTLMSKTDNISRMRSVSRFLRSSLERANPVPVIEMGNLAGYLLYGGPQELVWVTPMPVPGAQGGLVTVQLSVNEARQLVLKIHDGTGVWDWSGVKEHVLAESVDRFSVSFSEEVPAGQWLEQWPMAQMERPPALVRIDLQVGGRYWPPIVVVVPVI